MAIQESNKETYPADQETLDRITERYSGDLDYANAVKDAKDYAQIKIKELEFLLRPDHPSYGPRSYGRAIELDLYNALDSWQNALTEAQEGNSQPIKIKILDLATDEMRLGDNAAKNADLYESLVYLAASLPNT